MAVAGDFAMDADPARRWQMTLQVAQESRYQGKDWWEWAVWLKGTKAELSVIQRVVYTLHPTFPDPERTIKTRSNGFRLESAGWGGFTIYLKSYRTDGTTIKRKHELELEYPQQQPQAAKRASKAAAAPPAEAPHPRVYVSSGAADSAFTRKLREALTARGVQVTSAEDIGAGMP